MVINTHFGWFDKKIDLATLAESQLEELVHQFQNKTLKQDLYYENRLLLKKNKYLSNSLAKQVEVYYSNKKEQARPRPYITYNREIRQQRYAA